MPFWTTELQKLSTYDTCLKNYTSCHSLIETKQLSSQNKVKLGTLSWTDITSVSQRIRITVNHNRVLLFNIYWYIFSALSTEWGDSENQPEIKSFQQTGITTDSAELERTLEILWVGFFPLFGVTRCVTQQRSKRAY